MLMQNINVNKFFFDKMIEQQKIFLSPVSSDALFNNYKNSVVNGFSSDVFSKFSSSEKYQSDLINNETIRLWGIREAKITPFNKVSKGDLILFYHKGFIVGKSTIIFKDKNQKLSENIWGVAFKSFSGITEYWENIVFLNNFEKVNIDYQMLIKYAGFSEKASVRGFNQYPKIGVDNILLNFKTLNNFIKSHLV